MMLETLTELAREDCLRQHAGQSESLRDDVRHVGKYEASDNGRGRALLRVSEEQYGTHEGDSNPLSEQGCQQSAYEANQYSAQGDREERRKRRYIVDRTKVNQAHFGHYVCRVV